MNFAIFVRLMKTISIAGIFALAAGAANAEVILGKWKTEGGATAVISNCGGAFCIKLVDGDYKGKSIGRLEGTDGNYNGTILDPADDKEYTGSADVDGDKLKLKGCVMIFCKTQKWTRL